jgi:glycosyltransferase involved in cell wall biosynthesis
MSRSELRIALCTDGVFPHAMGGMQRHSRLLAEHLARQPGFRLYVLHPHAGVRLFDPALGIEEVHVPGIDPSALYLRELWRYSGRVAAALATIGPDAVLSQGFSVWKGMRRFSGKLAVMPHGLEMFQGLSAKDRIIGWPFRWAMRHVVRRASRVVSLGGRLTPVLQRLTAGSAARVTVIPNAVGLPASAPRYPGSAGPVMLLFVGRFAFNKGIDVLLQVARRLDSEGRGMGFRFVLAGDGPERVRMEAEGLPRNVELAGKVDDERLEQLYADCHALVLPTRFEGMPTVVLEAMARSRPVIVSDVGASAELVDEGNGFLLPPGDADALHRACIALAALDAAARERLGARGRERAASRFSWPAVAEEFGRLCAGLAAQRL